MDMRNLETQPVAELTDTELVEGCRRSDKDAMTALIRRHYGTSIRIARSILHNAQDSEDAVQTAYCQAFQHLHSFREQARFSTWITSIVVNQSLMHLRRARRVTLLTLDEPAAGRTRYFRSWDPTPEEIAARNEITSGISTALERLPKGLRPAYLLHAVSGLPVPEVARKLGLSVSAAKSRIFRARRTLESRLCRRFGPVRSRREMALGNHVRPARRASAA